MILKSSYRSIYTRLIIFPLSFVVLIIAILYTPRKEPWELKDTLVMSAGVGLALLVIAAGIIIHWIAFGREIELTEKGCIVRFLGFSKLYLWEQIKIKKRISIWIRDSHVDMLVYDGLLLSCRKVRFPKYIPQGYAFEVPTLHPFSLIFITFRPNIDPLFPNVKKRGKDKYENNPPGFFADEEQLFSLLHSWGVTLDDEKTGAA